MDLSLDGRSFVCSDFWYGATTTRLIFSRWGCDLVVSGLLIYQVANSHIDAVQCEILRLILP